MAAIPVLARMRCGFSLAFLCRGPSLKAMEPQGHGAEKSLRLYDVPYSPASPHTQIVWLCRPLRDRHGRNWFVRHKPGHLNYKRKIVLN